MTMEAKRAYHRTKLYILEVTMDAAAPTAWGDRGDVTVVGRAATDIVEDGGTIHRTYHFFRRDAAERALARVNKMIELGTIPSLQAAIQDASK